MKLRDLIADYVVFRQSMGPKFTGANYQLQAFCRAVGSDVDVREVSAERVLSFLGCPKTCYWHDKYYTLNVFYRYAISRGHVSSSPLPITVPKLPPCFVPYIYSVNEVRRLLDATASYRKIHLLLEPYTFRAIILILYGAGLRISEALSLRVGDVDLSAGVLLIRETKFYKSRLLPIGSDLKKALMGYATARREAGHSELPECPFFVGRNGSPVKIKTAQQSFRQLRKHAGIHRSDGARYQPRLHDFRHAFAGNRVVSWYKAGLDVQRLLPKLSTYLGHISLSSTQRYLTMTPALLQEACRRFEQYAMGGGIDE
jgi:site-specific recombinase XerD